MTDGIKTIIYPVSDLPKAKAVFDALGAQPYMNEVYYVGYNIDGQDIGLDPDGHRKGMTGPVCYFHVPDIKASLHALLDSGAQPKQDIKDVGGGKLTALVTDADGNAVGLIQPALDGS